MRDNTASETALRAARARARHQLHDPSPLLKDDEAVRLMEAHEPGFRTQRREGFIARAFRGGVVARSRIAEDALAQAMAHGVRQYVVLGAGLDTFGVRHRDPALKVFEVDHPATQAFKRELLARAGCTPPSTLTFVPVDLQRTALRAALWDAGWDPAQPTFFAWLGVVWYLERPTVVETLRLMGRCPPGSGVVFDCWHRPRPTQWDARLKLAFLRRRYARLGEPWITFFDHDELDALLAAEGFSRVARLDGEGINQALFGDGRAHLRLRSGRLFSITTAWV